MATPSPSPSPPPPHSPPSSPPPPSSKKPQPVPWSHQETVDLVRAYQERWYALKRGPLRSGQWEQLAAAAVPSKTPTQCRHKIEKLRRRYRSEKLRRQPSAWPFFGLMESLELGPMPISAQPMSQVPYEEDEDDDVSGGGSDASGGDEGFGKSRSINYILRRPTAVNRFAPARRLSSSAVYLRDQAEPTREIDGSSLVSRLAVEIRAFSERFVGVENMKMEAMRETERFRMEMESRRMGMILESQKRIVDTISRAFEEDDDEDE